MSEEQPPQQQATAEQPQQEQPPPAEAAPAQEEQPPAQVEQPAPQQGEQEQQQQQPPQQQGEQPAEQPAEAFPQGEAPPGYGDGQPQQPEQPVDLAAQQEAFAAAQAHAQALAAKLGAEPGKRKFEGEEGPGSKRQNTEVRVTWSPGPDGQVCTPSTLQGKTQVLFGGLARERGGKASPPVSCIHAPFIPRDRRVCRAPPPLAWTGR